MKIGVLSNIFESYSKNKEVENDLSEIGILVKKALDVLGHEAVFLDANEKVFDKIKKGNIDIVFNVCERFEDDAHKEPYVAGMLEKSKIPFTGSSSLVLALSNDKALMKQILVANRILTPEFQVFVDGNEKIKEDLSFPLIVKPTLEHNSIGLSQNSIVNSEDKLRKAVKKIITKFKQPCIAEKFIKGKDIEIGILGNGNNLKVLPLAEVGYEKFKGDKKELIFSYESKWDTNLDIYGDYIFPKNIPKKIEKKMKEIAVSLYKLVGIRDYGRVDFRLDENNLPYVIEVTANPGLSEVCSSPEAYAHMGLDYKDLINDILNHALERLKNKKD